LSLEYPEDTGEKVSVTREMTTLGYSLLKALKIVHISVCS